MAKITGGLHGRAAGNVGGIVYGAARTRIGKVVTARELVKPAYSDTDLQKIFRNKFRYALNPVRMLGSDFWKEDWNRAIGQLPGFQSMMSILTKNQSEAYLLHDIPVTPLGSLHCPDSFTGSSGTGGSGTITLSWSTEHGPAGSDSDTLYIGCVCAHMDNAVAVTGVDVVTRPVRSVGTLIVEDLTPGEFYFLACYFHGAGDFDGMLSPAKWVQGTAAT